MSHNDKGSNPRPLLFHLGVEPRHDDGRVCAWVGPRPHPPRSVCLLRPAAEMAGRLPGPARLQQTEAAGGHDRHPAGLPGLHQPAQRGPHLRTVSQTGGLSVNKVLCMAINNES